MADPLSLSELQAAASLCREQALVTRQSLCAAVRSCLSAAGDAGLEADAALALLDGVSEATLRELAQQHSTAASEVNKLRERRDAVEHVRCLAAATEEAQALSKSGSCLAAATCLSTAEAHWRSLAPEASLGVSQLWATCSTLRGSLAASVGAQLADAVQLRSSSEGGTVQVAAARELWSAAAALGVHEAVAAQLGTVAASQVFVPILGAEGLPAVTVTSGATPTLAWSLQRGSGVFVEAALLALARVLEFFRAHAVDPPAWSAFRLACWPLLQGAALDLASRAAATTDDAWAAARRGAIAVDAAATCGGLTSCATLASALADAQSQEESAVRGAWLSRARECVLRSSRDTLLVGGALRAPPSAMSALDVHGAPAFPACRVSVGGLALADMLWESAATSPRLCADLGEVFRACALLGGEGQLPGSCMVRRNDAALAAFVLLSVSAVTPAPELIGSAAALRSTGDAWLAHCVTAAAAESCSALLSLSGFQDVAEPGRRSALQRALAGALHAASRFSTLAADLLPEKIAMSTSEAVIGAVASVVLHEILAMQDVNIDDGAALSSIIDAALSQHSLPLAPRGRRKLARLRHLLDAKLLSIVDDFEAITADGITPPELARFVMAVFADSASRGAVLRRINGKEGQGVGDRK